MDANHRYRLYGAEISYYTGKVRAYLRWKALRFQEIPADAAAYREVIVPRVGFAVIPVVVTPDDATLQDSTEIIDALEARHGEPSVYPHTPLQLLVALLLELYGDEWLLLPAMHYRWHHNRDWAMRAFGELIAPASTPEEQLAIGERRAAPFAKAAESLGAETHMHEAIETSYRNLLIELDAHFAQLPYLLGTRPSIGDFGLVGPLYAHQYRDPTSGELMRACAPHVVNWVERMQHPPNPRSGAFLPEDAIPATLLPILRRMMREQLPVLAATANRLRDWIAQHPTERRVPRVLGKLTYDLEGMEGGRIAGPYSLWMLQRARDAYRGLDTAERARADQLLSAVHGEAFGNFADPPRLERDGLSVALAQAGLALSR
jgi:glutathione S-transferase